MANQWLRLWHDMPTDPKWKTIARVSGQPISLVQAVYLHLLVDASRNVTRGHVTVTSEDLASALDVSEQAINDVLAAMKGRVLDGEKLSGWDKRQVKREEGSEGETPAKSAAQRKREQREREREQQAESRAVTQGHEASRNVTLDKDKEEDKEKDIRGSDEPSHSTPESKSKAITLKTYIESREAAGLPPFDDGCGVYRYAEQINLPAQFLSIAWQLYRDRYYGGRKKYTDWHGAFLNALKAGWLKAWYLDGGVYKLTTVGQQAELARKSHAQH